MFTQILVLLLKVKAEAITFAQIPVIATLVVLGTTGFIVTGTISADDGDGKTNVELTVTSHESKKCVDALIAQTETLLTLDVLAGDALDQLHRMREEAAQDAKKQRKALGADALLAQFNASSEQVRAALATARQDVRGAADLATCEDRNPDTTVDVDVAVLRARYDEILRDFGKRLGTIVTDARKAFDELVRNAPAKPQAKNGGSGHSSHSTD